MAKTPHANLQGGLFENAHLILQLALAWHMAAKYPGPVVRRKGGIEGFYTICHPDHPGLRSPQRRNNKRRNTESNILHRNGVFKCYPKEQILQSLMPFELSLSGECEIREELGN